VSLLCWFRAHKNAFLFGALVKLAKQACFYSKN